MRLLSSLFLLIFSFSLSSQNYFVQEDFNNALLPNGWTNQAISGSQTWSFGINASTNTSGNNNLNGSNLAYFDDDALGASSTNNTAALITDTFDNSSFSTTYLEFDYNFQEFPGISDSFYVDVFDGSIWNRVFSRASNDCGAWTAPSCRGNYPHAKIDISALANANCRVRFVYHDGNNWGWGVGIDDVEIYSPYSNDVAVDSIMTFPSSCNANDSLKLVVRNLGTQSAFGFDLKYSINNGAAVTASFNNTIAPQTSMNFTFPNLITFNQGINNIEVYTDWSADRDLSNDTAFKSVNVLNSFILPYAVDFESSLSDWFISGSNPSWQIGSPSGTIINRAAGGQGAAVTNLNGNYNANEVSYLESPCIQLGAADSILRLSFDLIYLTETTYDKFWVETSFDGGNSWAKLLDNSNYRSINWYSNTQANYWAGLDSSWRKTSLVIESLPTNSVVKFRIAFQSDASANFEGVGIDNFSLDRLNDFDLSLKSIVSPNSNAACGFSQAVVEIELENYGSLAIDSGFLYYQVNSGTIYSDSLNFSIPAGAIRGYSFDSSYNFFNLSSFNLKCWIQIPGDSMPLNDSLQLNIQNYNPTQINQIPFVEDFDSFNPTGPLINDWGRIPAAPPNCYTWTVGIGSTGSVNTGPYNQNGNFLYLETSCGSSSAPDQVLVSPCIEIANVSQPLLFFDYHKYGASMGPLFVDVYDGQKWIQIDSIGGQTHNSMLAPWKIRGLDLINYRNYRIKIGFRGRKVGFQSDMAIDNVSIIDGKNDSIEFSDLKIDSATCLGSGQSMISFNFNKYFNSSLESDSLYFELFLNGNLVANERYPQGLSAYTFDSAFTFSSRPQISQAGVNNIKVRMNFTRNGQLIQDSLEKVITAKIDQLPYLQGFEGLFNRCFDGAFGNDPSLTFITDEGWSIGPSKNIGWHISDSSFCKYSSLNTTSLTYSIFTGPKTTIDSSAFVYWDQNIDTSSISSNLSYLYSPCFDLSNYSQARLEYWYHRYRELGQQNSMGSLVLEVKHSGGWVQIDRIDTMFFNVPTQKWLRSSIDITPYLDSNIQFRFSVSGSNPFYHTAIDAFKIFDPLTTSIEESRSHPHALTVYPNPNNGEFKIEVPDELIGKRYEIIDISGKVLKEGNLTQSRMMLNLDFPKGLYIIKVPSTNLSKKLLIYD